MKYGVAPTVMKSRNLVMEAMQHIVRTKYGESTLRYMQENGDFALAGETQGKGDVASLWSILSHTLLRAHQVMHEGIKLHHVNQETCISKNNDSFVDDTDAMASVLRSTYYQSEKATVAHLEQGAQLWATLINASGGAIAYHKSSWQILTWKDYVFPPQLKESSEITVTLRDPRGSSTEITQLKSSQPNKGLGCRLAPTACQEAEFDYRKAQCRQIAGRIQPRPLNICLTQCSMTSAEDTS